MGIEMMGDFLFKKEEQTSLRGSGLLAAKV
jgi:hypothetical protein